MLGGVEWSEIGWGGVQSVLGEWSVLSYLDCTCAAHGSAETNSVGANQAC